MWLIFGNTFVYHVRIFDIINLYQNMVIGLIVFYNRRFVRTIILILLLFALSLDVYEKLYPLFKGRTLHSINYLVFFFIVSIEVYKVLLYAKTVTRELLAAALCGFIFTLRVFGDRVKPTLFLCKCWRRPVVRSELFQFHHAAYRWLWRHYAPYPGSKKSHHVCRIVGTSLYGFHHQYHYRQILIRQARLMTVKSLCSYPCE